MDINSVNVEEIVKQVLSSMQNGEAAPAKKPAAKKTAAKEPAEKKPAAKKPEAKPSPVEEPATKFINEPAARMISRRHQLTDVKARGLSLSSSSPVKRT